MSTFEMIRTLLAVQYGVEPHTVDAGWSMREDGDADPLDLVETAMYVEEEFIGVHISDEEVENLDTMGELVKLVDSRLMAAAA